MYNVHETVEYKLMCYYKQKHFDNDTCTHAVLTANPCHSTHTVTLQAVMRATNSPITLRVILADCAAPTSLTGVHV